MPTPAERRAAQEGPFLPTFWQSLVLVAAVWLTAPLLGLPLFLLTGWTSGWEVSWAIKLVDVGLASLFTLWLGKRLAGKTWRQVVPLAPPPPASAPPFALAQVALSLTILALAVLAVDLQGPGPLSAAGAADAPWPKGDPSGRTDPWGPGLAALFEEPLYRGLILTGFLARYTRGRAILLNGLVFALAHLNIGQFLVPLVLGVFYAWVAAETGSIVLPVLGHLAHNLAAVALVRLDAAGRDVAREWAPVTAGLAPLLAVGALLLLRRSLANGRRPTAPPRPPAR